MFSLLSRTTLIKEGTRKRTIGGKLGQNAIGSYVIECPSTFSPAVFTPRGLPLLWPEDVIQYSLVSAQTEPKLPRIMHVQGTRLLEWQKVMRNMYSGTSETIPRATQNPVTVSNPTVNDPCIPWWLQYNAPPKLSLCGRRKLLAKHCKLTNGRNCGSVETSAQYTSRPTQIIHIASTNLHQLKAAVSLHGLPRKPLLATKR